MSVGVVYITIEENSTGESCILGVFTTPQKALLCVREYLDRSDVVLKQGGVFEKEDWYTIVTPIRKESVCNYDSVYCVYKWVVDEDF